MFGVVPVVELGRGEGIAGLHRHVKKAGGRHGERFLTVYDGPIQINVRDLSGREGLTRIAGEISFCIAVGASPDQGEAD